MAMGKNRKIILNETKRIEINFCRAYTEIWLFRHEKIKSSIFYRVANKMRFLRFFKNFQFFNFYQNNSIIGRQGGGGERRPPMR